ncbi:MAG: cysteine desulfurase family protein [Oscillospiraceae bacterium]|nr:cysteine desulfurase family protein [Oscillospiraceae bacterium]
MREIYLDNSATTRVAEPAAKEIYDMLVCCYGNPSSLYRKGLEAENRITAARKSLGKLLDCDPAQITFTSGGTEANNLALLGVAEARVRKGKRVVTTAFEHSSVAAAADRLEQLGWEVVRVKPDAMGRIGAKEVIAAVDESTVLVSCMCVNNEIGTILPIGEIVKGTRRKNPETLIHCDCVQALGKLPLSMRRLDLDLATVSAHKIYGPKGSGALYVRRGVRVLPRQLGGEQEKKLRPGTEASALIAGFGVAAELACEHLEADARRIADLNQALRCRLLAMPQVVINSPPDALPAVLNISVPGYRSETMMHFLAERGISVSSGSACAKGAKSHVLSAMGLAPGLIDSALRISFGRYNVPEDVEDFVLALREGICALAHR